MIIFNFLAIFCVKHIRSNKSLYVRQKRVHQRERDAWIAAKGESYNRDQIKKLRNLKRARAKRSITMKKNKVKNRN